MNHTYRVVYNEATNTYTAVAENVPARGKSSKSKKALAAVVAAAALQLTAVSAEAAVAISKTDTVQAQLNANGAVATGNNIAIGENAKTGSVDTIAIGANTTSSITNGTIAVGSNATIGGEKGSVAIGENSVAGKNLSYIGHVWYKNPYNSHTNRTAMTSVDVQSDGTNAVDTSSVALGKNAIAEGSSTAIGSHAKATLGGGTKGLKNRALSVAIGSNTLATSGGVSIGGSTAATGYNTVAIGRQAAAVGDGSSAYGVSSASVGEFSTAFGQSATAFGQGSIAIGSSTDNVANAQSPSDQYQNYKLSDNTVAYGTNAIALGRKARTGGDNAALLLA